MQKVRFPYGLQGNRRNLSNSKGFRRFSFVALSPRLSVSVPRPLQLVTMPRSRACAMAAETLARVRARP